MTPVKQIIMHKHVVKRMQGHAAFANCELVYASAGFA